MPNLIHRCKDSILFGPSESIDSASNRSALNSGLLRPLNERLGFASYGDEPVSSCVARLLEPQSPPAICRFIISIVIDSVKRVIFARALSHVCVKGVKRLLPRIANLYSATSPVIEISVITIATSLLHVLPSAVRNAFRHAVRLRCTFLIGIKASATFCVSRFETIRSNINDFSTIAFTFPENCRRHSATAFYHSSLMLNCQKPSKSFSSKIVESSHENTSLIGTLFVSTANYTHIAMSKQGVYFA